MADLYKNTCRIASARLQTWDYTFEGLYFVTICTKDRVCFLVMWFDGKDTMPCVSLSEIGETARDEWYKTPGLQLTDDSQALRNYLCRSLDSVEIQKKFAV